MATRTDESIEPLDGATSRTICRAVGQRLQQDFRPEQVELPPHLRDLITELQRQDRRN